MVAGGSAEHDHGCDRNRCDCFISSVEDRCAGIGIGTGSKTKVVTYLAWSHQPQQPGEEIVGQHRHLSRDPMLEPSFAELPQ